ncbi:ATP-binding protein [Streptomyces mangrovisoli]|uniref:ATP-binding protein n=1 Tax=Streptomyces mangrovisoli TaxID=1428628 RepID=UPI0023E394FD|nr:ATP-binding protein [Streptomyces mangrovisoli]
MRHSDKSWLLAAEPSWERSSALGTAAARCRFGWPAGQPIGIPKCGVLGTETVAVFCDEVVSTAMIGRLVHHAPVLTLTGDSHRTRQRQGDREHSA